MSVYFGLTGPTDDDQAAGTQSSPAPSIGNFALSLVVSSVVFGVLWVLFGESVWRGIAAGALFAVVRNAITLWQRRRASMRRSPNVD